MKVLILSDAQSIHTKRWVSSLVGRGIDIVLFSIKPETDNFYTDAGVKVYVYDLFKYKKLGKISAVFKSVKEHRRAVKYLKSVIKRETPDILHAHYATSYGLIASLSGFSPFVISVWGSDIYEFPKKSLINKSAVKYILGKADFITSTSNAMAVESSKYCNKRIDVVPFGVDTSLFDDTEDIRDGRIVIGTVKTLSHNYGIDTLIQAYKIFADNNPDRESVLEIVGDGPDREKLEKIADELGIGERVIFRGYIENSRLPEVYNSFDIAVFLSRRESFGVSAVEASSCGTAIVASDTDGFKEVLEDGVTGIIVPKENPSEACAAIQFLAENPQKRAEFGKAARENVLSQYDWNRNVSQMISIYIKAINGE